MHQFLNEPRVHIGHKQDRPALPPLTFLFLQELVQNNQTQWFNDQRQRYQSAVVAPIRSLIGDLTPILTQLNPDLDVSYRVNTTVMRINRDRRFHPAAAPYRTYIKVSFPIQGRKWSEDPVFGFGVFPTYFYVAFRNAGKARQEFVQRYNKNLINHHRIFQRWLECCQVTQRLFFLGGQHDDIEALAPCSPQIEDWLNCIEPTVGRIWSLKDFGSFKETVDLLVRLYFLKLLTISEDLEQDAIRYFAMVEQLLCD